MRHGRRATGAIITILLGASLAACGGSDEPSSTGPTSSSTSAAPTPSESPTESASASPTTPPLSRFEDDPAVQAARAWSAALAKDVNAADTSYANTKPLTAAGTKGRLDVYGGDDIKAGLQYPGPLPFTPLRIREAGTKVTVVSCAWVEGWGIDPKTNKPTQKRFIDGSDFIFRKTAAGYKLVSFAVHEIDCSDVNVKGVAF